jgi:hypothetical protein
MRWGPSVHKAGLQVGSGLGGGRVEHAWRRGALPQRQLRGQVHRIGLRTAARTSAPACAAPVTACAGLDSAPRGRPLEPTHALEAVLLHQGACSRRHFGSICGNQAAAWPRAGAAWHADCHGVLNLTHGDARPVHPGRTRLGGRESDVKLARVRRTAQHVARAFPDHRYAHLRMRRGEPAGALDAWARHRLACLVGSAARVQGGRGHYLTGRGAASVVSLKQLDLPRIQTEQPVFSDVSCVASAPGCEQPTYSELWLSQLKRHKPAAHVSHQVCVLLHTDS